MKTHIVIVTIFAVAGTAFAAFFTQFNSWNDLIKQSPDILIVRCNAILEATMLGESITTNRIATSDGLVRSDINIISVLKGNANLGLSHMQSSYRPHQGESFLVFVNNYSNDQFYKGYNVIENFRVVPLNRSFRTNELAGKPLHEQVQLLLNSRLKDLNDEIARDNEEKKRFEDSLNKGSTEVNMSNNVPPTIPSQPRTGGASF